MGEKRARAEEADESQRKAPRLDLLAAAAAVADSGRDEAAAPEVSNPREERAEGTSDKKPCNHVPTYTAHMKIMRLSLLSERARRCEVCPCPVEGSSILMCLKCGSHFCSGVGSVEYPFGHSRQHAKREQHWVAVRSVDPESAFCFKCECVTVVPRDAIRGLSAAAEEDSGSDDDEWPEVTNLGVEGTSNEPCNHVPEDSAHTEMLLSSLSPGHAGMCERCKTFDGSRILVCLERGRHLCAGHGSVDQPFGHSRMHAQKKQHWVAALYDDPESAYCFKCGYVVCVTLSPDDTEMMDKDEAGGHASELSDKARDVIRGLADAFKPLLEKNAFKPAYVHDYAIRGIPNLGETCYLNAMVQCLLVLDKLRARMLGPDAPKNLLATALRELFMETSTAGSMLNPEKFLTYVRLRDETFRPGMQDSHELLLSLRKCLNEDEKKGQNGAPTVMDSIFEFELTETKICKCGFSNVSHMWYSDLSVPLPSKWHSAKSAALSDSSQTSESLKSQPKKFATQLSPVNEQSNSEKIQTVAESDDSHLLGSELKDVVVEETPEPLEVDSTEAQRIRQSKDVIQGHLKMQEDKVSCPELSQGIIEVPVKSVSLLPHNVSDVKVEEMNEMTANSTASIEDCLSLFCEQVTDGLCDNCYKVCKELSANPSKNGEQMAVSTTETTTVDGDQAEQLDRTTCQNEQSSGSDSLSVECKSSSSRQPHGSGAQVQIIQTVAITTEGINVGISCGEKDSAACSTTNKESECHQGIVEAAGSCLPDDKQINLFRAHHSGDVSIQIKMYQDSRKQIGPDHGAYQLKDDRNEQKDWNGDSIQKHRFNKLPPVLTLHLKRYTNRGCKISEHVRFKEYLDVGPFMDPSSVEKDNCIYRLVGVVEHRGTESLTKGHYVAYVRARRLGNPQQQSSCSQSWFLADDSVINEVSLEEVLEREAYVLFYERMDGEDISDTSSDK